ncbi:MAG: hypothetical protein ACO3SE_07395 [Sedimenticolaceae bacterium]
MASSVIKFSDLSLSDVTFSDIRKNANNGGKTIYLNGRGKSKLFVQLPKMKAPFGLGINEYDGKTSYSLPMAADDPTFVDFLKKFDDMVVAKVVENSETYLGKSMNETVVREALYTALFKPPSDEKYAPIFKTKILANQDGTFVPQVFTTDKEPCDLRALDKGQYVTAIVHIPSIWFVGTKFGVTIRLQQLRVTPSQKLTEYAFVDDDDEHEDDESFEDSE